MANTYSQLNIHCVFAVQGRENLITKNFRDELHKNIYGIIKNDNAFPLSIGGWLDHVHVFFELHPDRKISDHLRMLKATSSKWINDHKFVNGKFQWQEGYGAFSYSRSQRNDVIKYIINQEEHHRKQTFKEEYLGLLKKFEVDYDEKYLLEFYD